MYGIPNEFFTTDKKVQNCLKNNDKENTALSLSQQNPRVGTHTHPLILSTIQFNAENFSTYHSQRRNIRMIIIVMTYELFRLYC